MPLYARSEAKALPNADQLLRDAAAARDALSRERHGVVKLGDLYDRLKAAHPALSLEDFHRQVIDWQAKDKITVGAVNDVHQERPESLARMMRVPDFRGFARVLGYVTDIRNVPPGPASFSVVGTLRAEFAWDESQHPRGQPANRGQFGPGGGGAGDPKAERLAARAARVRERDQRERAVREKLGADRIARVKAIVSDLLPRYQHVTLYGRQVKALDPSVPENDLVAEMGRRGFPTAGGAAHRVLDAMVYVGELAKVTTGAGGPLRPNLMRVSYRLRHPASFAEFYSPDQARDWRGRWTSGGGEGAAPVPTHAERGQLRQASLQAVREYVRAGGQPSRVENEQLAAHLARLTVDQLHAVKAEHGLKASAKDKAALVTKLVERFRAHRQTQEPAGSKALKEAVAGKPGFHNVREVVGGHAVTHGPTGSQVRADHAGTRFDVVTSGSTIHSSHATAAAAVKAAEQSGRFGTGQSTAEQESRARHEAIANAQKRAAAEPVREHVRPSTVDTPSQGALNSARQQKQAALQRVRDLRERIKNEPLGRARASLRLQLIKAESAHAAAVLAERQASQAVEARANELGQTTTRPPAAAPPAPAGAGKQPHEMTKAEWEDEFDKTRANAQGTGGDRGIGGMGRSSSLKGLGARADAIRARQDFLKAGLKDRRVEGLQIPARHRDVVEAALAAGKHVPEHVLKDYPDLARKYRRKFASFSVAGALSPAEAEERATLRRVESYANRENARLRAVREGVRA